MKHDASFADKYEPAMKIEDQAEADAYFETCVEHAMQFGRSRSRAIVEQQERDNLGYYAGYFDNETRARVERLFRCEHPFFGSIEKNGPPTEEEAFQLGLQAGRKRL